jgi:hypothetical protein
MEQVSIKYQNVLGAYNAYIRSKEELALIIAHKLCSISTRITAIVDRCNDKNFI